MAEIQTNTQTDRQTRRQTDKHTDRNNYKAGIVEELLVQYRQKEYRQREKLTMPETEIEKEKATLKDRKKEDIQTESKVNSHIERHATRMANIKTACQTEQIKKPHTH